MNKKWLPYLLVLGLAVVLFAVKRCNQVATLNKPPKITTSGRSGAGTRSQSGDPASVDRNRGFDRRAGFIEYTKHGKCRMECRHISQAEVEEIMRDGTINYKKNNVNARPCPEYALEGTTSDGQRVRIVFAQCDLKTKVVTTIDLGQDWSCDCPGDEKK